MSCDTFTVTGDNSTVTLNMPQTITFNDVRDVKTFNFWDATTTRVIDIGKNSENITISGRDDWTHLSTSSERYEYYNVGTDQIAVDDNEWKAQGFTIGNVGSTTTFILTNIFMKLERIIGNSLSDVTVRIRKTPGGTDLCKKGIPVTEITTNDSGEWVDFPMDKNNRIMLEHTSSGTDYYIVISNIRGRVDMFRNNSGTYDGGVYACSADSGITWNFGFDNVDALFKLYGYPASLFVYMKRLDDMVDNGEEVTLAGFDQDDFNTTWYIENFEYSISEPSFVNWSLTLEKSY